MHSAAAFSLCPGLMEVTLFGGCLVWPSNPKTDADYPQIANTTVLGFGESTSCKHHSEHGLEDWNRDKGGSGRQEATINSVIKAPQ